MQSEIVKEWIEKAEEDFGFASQSIEHTDYFAQICFHFQQAAEKYLKTFIIANELEFRPVRNLLELLEISRQREPAIEKSEEACRYLNPSTHGSAVDCLISPIGSLMSNLEIME